MMRIRIVILWEILVLISDDISIERILLLSYGMLIIKTYKHVNSVCVILHLSLLLRKINLSWLNNFRASPFEFGEMSKKLSFDIYLFFFNL